MPIPTWIRIRVLELFMSVYLLHGGLLDPFVPPRAWWWLGFPPQGIGAYPWSPMPTPYRRSCGLTTLMVLPNTNQVQHKSHVSMIFHVPIRLQPRWPTFPSTYVCDPIGSKPLANIKVTLPSCHHGFESDSLS
jgi:hypothetical protein